MSDEGQEYDLPYLEEAWEYLNDNHANLATNVKKMVKAGYDPEEIKRRALRIIGSHREPMGRRVENAARYLMSQQPK